MTFIEGEPIFSQTETYELSGEEKPSLTPRQIEVLESAARGLSCSQIGEELGIAHQTVKNHFGSRSETYEGIFVRLNACSRREAVVKAIDFGLLDPEKFVQEEELKRCKLLTERQMEILRYLADPTLPSIRTMDREIADKLGNISPQTVRNHISSIIRKLRIEERGTSASTRAAVIFLAYQQREKTISPFHETLRGLPEVAY